MFEFSTRDYAERDRVEGWREIFGRAVVKVEMEPLGDGPFYCEAQIQSVPDLTVARVASSPNRVTRTARLAEDGSDDLIFGIVTSGTAIADQGGREALIVPGSAVLWSNAQPASTSYTGAVNYLALTIPRSVLGTMVSDLPGRLMQVVPASSSALKLLGNYVDMLQADLAGMTPGLRALGVAHVHDLVALALGASRDAAETAKGRGVRAARLAAIKADIAANIGRRDLSPEGLAARHGISSRYLRALFDGEETTLTAFVLGQRLAHARRMLVNPSFDHWTISAIAFDSGFGDLSYFNRVFRRQFGASPSDVRAGAR